MHKHKISSTSDVDSCPICGSVQMIEVISNVTDNVAHAVDYVGSILQCTSCGHGFLSPIINEDQLHLAYDGYYTQSQINLDIPSNATRDRFSLFIKFYEFKYMRVFSAQGVTIFLLSKLIPFFGFFLERAVRFVPVPDEHREVTILDVGCGRGDFLMRARQCGYVAKGIDFDPDTIGIAKKRGLDVQVCEIQDLPTDIKYDVISLSHVIEHVKDPVAMLREIHCRLEVGGYFYIAAPNFHSAARKTFDRNWRGCDAPRHLQFFNMDQLESTLTDVGFSKVERVYDLAQGLNCIKASYQLKYKSGISSIDFFRELKSLIRLSFWAPRRLDTSVFKCYR